MLRFTRHIASLLTLLFAAVVASCPVIACTSVRPVEGPKHSCCPKKQQPAEHSTKSTHDCPLLMTEFRAGFVKDKLSPVPVTVALAVVPLITPAPVAGEPLSFEHFAPDKSDLHVRLRVLRI